MNNFETKIVMKEAGYQYQGYANEIMDGNREKMPEVKSLVNMIYKNIANNQCEESFARRFDTKHMRFGTKKEVIRTILSQLIIVAVVEDKEEFYTQEEIKQAVESMLE